MAGTVDALVPWRWHTVRLRLEGAGEDAGSVDVLRAMVRCVGSGGRLGRLLAVAVLATLISGGCTVAPAEVEDEALQARTIEDDLATFARKGWFLHLFEVPEGSDLSDASSLEVDFPDEPADRAERTLVFVATAGDQPAWRILGNGGGSIGESAGLVAIAVDARVQEQSSRPGFDPAVAFVSGLAAVLEVDLAQEYANQQAPSVAAGLVGLFALLCFALGVFALPFNWWRHRHSAEVRPIGHLPLDEISVIEGEIVCEEPLWIDEIGEPAAYMDRVSQRMKTKETYSTHDEHTPYGNWVRVHTTTVHELGWKDVRHNVSGAWFKVRDGSGEIWVNPEGAKIDGHEVAASGRRGDRREVVRAIPAGGPIAVRGRVRSLGPDGSAVIGGRGGRASDGFVVSVNGARGLSRAGRIGCAKMLVYLALFVALPILVANLWL